MQNLIPLAVTSFFQPTYVPNVNETCTVNTRNSDQQEQYTKFARFLNEKDRQRQREREKKRNLNWKENFNNLHINITKSVNFPGHGLKLQVTTLALICCRQW